MRLTSRSRYAVTAMLDLAIHGGERPVCLASIAERQQISLAYLERLFRELRRFGLVCSTRGAHGGYQLCSCADSISVAAVMHAVDEPLDATVSKDGDNEQDAGVSSLTDDLWAGLTNHIQQYLTDITLGELCVAQVAVSGQDRRTLHSLPS